MADEKDDAEEGKEDEEGKEEAPAAKPKSGKMKMIIIIVVALAVLGGGGAVLWFKVIAPAIGAGGEKEEKKVEPEKIEATMGPMFPMDPFIVNLAGEGGKKFLKLTMELELDNEALNAEITASLPKIKDSILILLSSKTFEDIYSVEGKFKLRGEVTTRINLFLVSGRLRNIYFTEFVIQ